LVKYGERDYFPITNPSTDFKSDTDCNTGADADPCSSDKSYRYRSVIQPNQPVLERQIEHRKRV
jgi:hypothetical protein